MHIKRDGARLTLYLPVFDAASVRSAEQRAQMRPAVRLRAKTLSGRSDAADCSPRRVGSFAWTGRRWVRWATRADDDGPTLRMRRAVRSDGAALGGRSAFASRFALRRTMRALGFGLGAPDCNLWMGFYLRPLIKQGVQ